METNKKPEWLKVRYQSGGERARVEQMLAGLSLNTVCEHASCPNLMECYSRKTATFMILGSICSRNCKFCNVSKGKPVPVDPQEPENVAKAVETLGLKHAVITSVTRDDLPDGGSGHFAEVIKRIRLLNPKVTTEVLIPDFKGELEQLKTVADACPDVINHNVETVPRLYPNVRPMAVYERSLQLLANVKKLNPKILTKSGIMVGLGEKTEEVLEVLRDLRAVDCDLLTIGQYLAPSPEHHKVIEYIRPEVFEYYKTEGEKMGFRHVASGPLVRSSYHADEAIKE
ncbi:MAG: lipoyl synthase [Clostridiales bacterium]|nr:lipoyl synthase [Clostridiales bacterium]